MGTRGPVPKRSEDRRRRNAPKREVVSAPSSGGGVQPEASEDWHPIAKRLWAAMGDSGQSAFYEPSDWAVAYSLMDDLSYYKSGAKRSGQMLQTIMSSMSTLLVTEGDRRRLQIELARPGAEDVADQEKVVVMDKWRKRLG